MGLCSSKNAVAPQKPLKTLEQLEQENGENARPTAFVIPADDVVVSTKKPNDLEAEKERLAKERSQLNKLQQKMAEKEKRVEENRAKELEKIVARQEEREERARQVQEKKKQGGGNGENSYPEIGSKNSLGKPAPTTVKTLNPIKLPAHLRRMEPGQKGKSDHDVMLLAKTIFNSDTIQDSAVNVHDSRNSLVHHENFQNQEKVQSF